MRLEFVMGPGYSAYLDLNATTPPPFVRWGADLYNLDKDGLYHCVPQVDANSVKIVRTNNKETQDEKSDFRLSDSDECFIGQGARL